MDASNDEKKPAAAVKHDQHFIAIVNSLLDSLSEKDDTLRNMTEASLIRIAKQRHDEIVEVFCDYRKKHPKLGETQAAIILSHETASKCVEYSVNEITRSPDQQVQVQAPCREILVSVGRRFCKEVMDALTKHVEQHQVAHFMIPYAMGSLATANIMDSIPLIKPILGYILPTLSSIKQDYIRQSYAFAIGRFCEAFCEYKEHRRLNPNEEAPMKTGVPYDICDEVGIAYELFQSQWLSSREPKVSYEVLNALSFMYPLLSVEKINEGLLKVVPSTLALYRRSVDRSVVTQYLAAIIKTVQALNAEMLSESDTIIATLFDLVCVNPDYEKPQTVKGHYEVLRCFDLMAGNYGKKIIAILLLHLRSNNERERIKSLLVLTHLTNTSEPILHEEQEEITTILKGMLTSERSIKLKMVLLKTIVAFMQRNLVHEKEFVTFLIRGSCRLNKFSTENGTSEEYQEFVTACNNTMFILSTTIGTMDDVLKMELLQSFLRLEYTDICSTIGKCLANLLAKDPIPERRNPFDRSPTDEDVRPPSAISVFVRSLALLGNYDETARVQNILSFLKSYSSYLYRHLTPLWNQKLGQLLQDLQAGSLDRKRYDTLLFEFIQATIKDVDEFVFIEGLIAEIFQQLPLYQPITPGAIQVEFKVPSLDQEKRMLVKVLGMCLSHSMDEHVIENKIDLIIGLAKAEKLEKNASHEDYEKLLQDHAQSLAYVSVEHVEKVMKKLIALVIDDGSVKKSSSFFSNLHFIKDTSKETENFKLKILVLQSLNNIVAKAPREKVLRLFDESIVNYLTAQFDNKELFIRKYILTIFLNLAEILVQDPNALPDDHMNNFKNKNELLKICMNITCDSQNEYLPLFPLILKLSTLLIKLNAEDENVDFNGLLNTACYYFFTTAQNLKSKFESVDEDNRNSYLAKYLNQSLPELNQFIRTILEQQNGSPACLDDINSILEIWLKDRNNEVRICAGHVYNSTLDVYMRSMKIGCEAPSKFNQTGSLLGKIIPRCIDSNATVRQTAIEVLKKILEIACIYETLTIADNRIDWVKELDQIRDEIITDDAKDIYRIAGQLANIIAQRLSSYQYVQFSKCLLYSLNDPEQSSAIGASVVLKFFIQAKGSEMFHAIPELVKECLYAVKICEVAKARSGVLKSMLALTKHHPKLVCNEVLGQSLPFEENVIDYWRTITLDAELTGIILENFIGTVTTSCLYEQQHQDKPRDDSQKAVTLPPFTIICVLNEMFKCKEIRAEIKARFTEIFCMLLSTVATYINLLPPCNHAYSQEGVNVTVPKSAKRGKAVASKDVKLVPCQVALDTFKVFLDTLEMQQIFNVLDVCPNLGSSTDLNSFIEILTPLSIATAGQVGINSTTMKQIVTTLSKYVSSPYDTQRIASAGFYSHLVPLKPCGDISSVIMLHLNSSLNDPNPLVRGLSIRGMAFLCSLTEHDIDKYAEMCLTALLKGIDDYNKNCFINIPLESMRGLSKILQTLPQDKFEMFQVSLAIRIKPFFENASIELRESAILLFGDLCHQKVPPKTAVEQVPRSESNGLENGSATSESLLEQMKANLCSLLLHLCEENNLIARACKITLKNVCTLLATPKMNQLAQNHLLEHGQLQYNNFIKDFSKLIGEELPDSIGDFIDACLPSLRSQWSEIRGNAAVLIGLLYTQNRSVQHMDPVGHKISLLLKDEDATVKVKAAEALGYIYGEC
ncbi:maestro heat-like repeat-containing protein family member 1 isoform X2 [Wyeomyia smithii]|uniref:maestro heat-like repeat-containing protein family member 1 isoform X2 n=1 Tax=Wyeomyia smithii TaxID=174621 RepID=UPI002467F1FD|nr:maestro heat-like repeat-containing protein family member 1 isoform X2 [Wyeomyia smithii]